MARHSSLGDFAKHIRGRGAKLDSEVTRLLRETVVNVVTEVSRDTPILTGQAQSNWLTNIGSSFPYYIANETSNNAYHDSVAWAKRVMATAKSTDKIHITNRVPYIVKLNRGSSKQAPALFVQTATLRAAYRIQGFKINWN